MEIKRIGESQVFESMLEDYVKSYKDYIYLYLNGFIDDEMFLRLCDGKTKTTLLLIKLNNLNTVKRKNLIMRQEKQFINNKQQLFDAVIKQYRKELSKYVEVNQDNSYFKFRIPFGLNIVNGNEIVFDTSVISPDGEEDITTLDFFDATINFKNSLKEDEHKLTEELIYNVAKALVDQHINQLIEIESDPEGEQLLEDIKKLEYIKKS